MDKDKDKDKQIPEVVGSLAYRFYLIHGLT